MSQHHNTDSIQHLYEGDQSKLYSGVLAHHGDAASSKAQIKRILKITVWLSVITIVEVIIGLTAHSAGIPSGLVATIFLLLTLLKAGLIVRVFMHLGDEKKNFITTVLIPLALFVWFIIAFLADGAFWLKMNKNTVTRIDYHSTK